MQLGIKEYATEFNEQPMQREGGNCTTISRTYKFPLKLTYQGVTENKISISLEQFRAR